MGNNNQIPYQNSHKKKSKINKETISLVSRVINECLVNQMSSFNTLSISNPIAFHSNTHPYLSNQKHSQLIDESKYLHSCFDLLDANNQCSIYFTPSPSDCSNIDRLLNNEDKVMHMASDTNDVNERTMKLKEKRTVKTLRLDNHNREGAKKSPSKESSPTNLSVANIKKAKKKKKVKQIVLNIDFKKYKVLNTSFSPNKTLNYNNTSVYSGASASMNMNNKSINSQPVGSPAYEKINYINSHLKNQESNGFTEDNQFKTETSYLQKMKNKLKLRQDNLSSSNESPLLRSKTPTKKIENTIIDDDLDNYKEKFKERLKKSPVKDTTSLRIKSKYNEFVSKMAKKGQKDMDMKELNKSQDDVTLKNKEIGIKQRLNLQEDSKDKEITTKTSPKHKEDHEEKDKGEKKDNEKLHGKIVSQFKNHLAKITRRPFPKTEKTNRSVDNAGVKDDIFGIIHNVKYKPQPDSDEENEVNSKESNKSNSNESNECDSSLPIIRESIESSTSKKSSAFDSPAPERFSFRPKQ